MPDFFISYPMDEDLQWADRIAVLLEELGYEAHYAPRHFSGRWPDEVERLLAESTWILAIVSPEYLRSTHCMDEWDAARQREADEGRRLLLVAKARQCRLPLRDSGRLCADLDGVADEDEQRQRLLHYLGWHLPPRIGLPP